MFDFESCSPVVMRIASGIFGILSSLALAVPLLAADGIKRDALEREFSREIRPLMKE